MQGYLAVAHMQEKSAGFTVNDLTEIVQRIPKMVLSGSRNCLASLIHVEVPEGRPNGLGKRSA